MKKIFVLILSFIFTCTLYADGEKLLDSSNALQSVIQKGKIPPQLLEKTVAIAVFSNVHQANS